MLKSKSDLGVLFTFISDFVFTAGGFKILIAFDFSKLVLNNMSSV
ncbi:hypothetical protein LEP1GSC036_0285 [Leptospira weilii str. 2006001853]|uniref:Uncharacterized protein n=1 Tax=Leptospira weilii str. 2006001853 TaxID=1001589 RepID=A0A828Z5D5_9LEPT|nr:hypothetical protein LEP1GSC036_0285 [Leptospira weilii str. 2006001853]